MLKILSDFFFMPPALARDAVIEVVPLAAGLDLIAARPRRFALGADGALVAQFGGRRAAMNGTIELAVIEVSH